MHVLDFSPINESFSTWVNLEARKGRWPPRRPSALIHSFKANKDLLISDPSIPICVKKFYYHKLMIKYNIKLLVCLSDELVSAPRSFPARSTRENLP